MFCSNLKHCLCCIAISQGLIFWSLFDLLAQLLLSFILFQWINLSTYEQSLPLMGIFICNVIINLFLLVSIVQRARGKLLVWQYTTILSFLAIFGYILHLHLQVLFGFIFWFIHIFPSLYLSHQVYPGMEVVLMGIVVPILFCYYGYWWLLVNSYRCQISSAAVSPFKEQEAIISKEDIYHIDERESRRESYNNNVGVRIYEVIENPYLVPNHQPNLPIRLHTPLSTPSHLHTPLSTPSHRHPLTPLATHTSTAVSPLKEQEFIIRKEDIYHTDERESRRESYNTIVVELNS